MNQRYLTQIIVVLLIGLVLAVSCQAYFAAGSGRDLRFKLLFELSWLFVPVFQIVFGFILIYTLFISKVLLWKFQIYFDHPNRGPPLFSFLG